MGDPILIGERRPWWKVGRTVGDNPFSSLGIVWCPRCRTEVDSDVEAHHRTQSATYAYRRRCLRCGRVIAYGAYQNVPLLSNRPMPAAALEWCFERGRDNR